MSSEINDIVGTLSEEGLQCIVNCAVAIGCADGKLDAAERKELTQNLMALVEGDKAAVKGYIESAVEAVEEWDRDSLFEEAGEQLDEDACEACFIIAAAVGGKSGGTGGAEGVALQALANALGIEAMSQSYFKLLAKGQALAKS
jgi:uncharacterized membrane protein YebE (DUF533 family)